MKQIKRMQLGVLLATLLIVSMLFVPIVVAQGENKKIDKKIEEVISLQPEAGSAIILDSVKVTQLPNGSLMINGSGLHKPGEPAQYYRWEANITKKTYKITKLDPSTAKFQIPTITKEEINNTKVQNVGIAAISPGSHWAIVWVQTTDPVWEQLAETANRLEWTVYSNGQVGYNYRRVSCFPSNPTSFGTHWYNSVCSFVGSVSYSSDQTSLFSQAKGNYYNYDFGNPNQATYTNHLSQIQGKNDGSNAYSWSDVHSGEYWWLLWGHVYVDGG